MNQLDILTEVNNKHNLEPFVPNGAVGDHLEDDLYKDTPDGGSWVCKDYSLAKTLDLIDNYHWDKTTLSYLKCWTEPVVPPTSQNNGGREYHMVVCAIVDNVKYILDNRVPYVYRKDDPVFSYIWDYELKGGTLQWIKQ